MPRFVEEREPGPHRHPDPKGSALKQALAGLYPEVGAGDFTKLDGTVEFYGRISALLRPDMEVLDLGAGRGWQLEIPDPFRRGLVTLQGRVRRLVGVDVDPAVLTNPGLDEALVYDGTTLPFADQSFDLVLSDWVLEHIDDPAMFTAEVARVLRPGGWFCARTPHTVSISAIGSRMVPNRSHARFLTKVQKGEREAKDVFPTRYRLNTLRAIRRYFPAARSSREWKRSISYQHSLTRLASPPIQNGRARR